MTERCLNEYSTIKIKRLYDFKFKVTIAMVKQFVEENPKLLEA